MEVTYQLLESEFDQKIVKSIKSTFKNSLITIVVRNGQATNRIAEKEHEYAVSISYDALSNIIESFEKDDSYELMEALGDFKVTAK